MSNNVLNNEMRFKLWLEAEYERWEKHVASLHRESPFLTWFPPSGRIYIPFQQSEEHDEERQEIAEFLDDIGYEIYDWQKGLAIEKGSAKQPIRIGKILNKIYQEDLEKLDAQLQQNQISQKKFDSARRSIKSYFEDLNQAFQTSPTRARKKGGSDLVIALSINPHDIAKMSTDRAWTSCMDLGKGEHEEDIFCEVEKGGFVAYLIHENDKEIKDPLARVHIRRFENKQGDSIAIVEDNVYGANIKGFRETVQQWLDQKQGSIRPGRYTLKGGSYSDTYASDEYIAPKSEEGLAKILNDYKAINREYEKERMEPYILSALEQIAEGNYSDELTRFAMDIARGKDGWWYYRSRLAEKNPDLVSQEDFENLPFNVQKNIVKKLPRFKDYLLDKAKDKIDELVSKDIQDIDYEANLLLRYIEVFDRLPKPIETKIAEHGNKLLDNIGSIQKEKSPITRGKRSSHTRNLLNGILHALAIRKAAQPEAIEFYKRMWPEDIDIKFLRELSMLKEKGSWALPRLKQELENEENPGIREALLYTIDTIQTGKSSRKYSSPFFS